MRSQPTRLIGIVTRSHILSAYRRQIEEIEAERPEIHLPQLHRVRSIHFRESCAKPHSIASSRTNWGKRERLPS
jgi:hypothetical protein